MPIRVDVGTFSKDTDGTGTQDVTIPVDLSAGGTIAAIIFFSVGNSAAYGTVSADIRAALGFAALQGGVVTEGAVALTSNDNVATSDTARRITNAKCLTFISSDGATVLAEADFVGFLSGPNRMRLDWTINDAVARKIGYMIISGLTAAKVVDWTTPTSVTSKSITAIGFNPDLMFHLSSWLTAALPVTSTWGQLGFGMMNKHGQQVAFSINSADAAGAANTSRWQQTDACLLRVDDGDVASEQVTFFGTGSDGFTVYEAVSGASAYRVLTLCLDGISSKIGSFILPAGTSIAVPSRHGFTPRGLLMAAYSSGVGPTPIPHACFSIGASDLTNECCVLAFDRDTADPMEADCVAYSDKVFAHINSFVGPVIRTYDLSSISETALNLAINSADANIEDCYCILGDAGEDTFPAMVAV